MSHKKMESKNLKEEPLSENLNKEDGNEAADVDIETSQDLQALLRENLEMTKEIRAMVRHINVYVAWQRIFGWLKVLLILIPVILGIIYLPPIFSDAYHNFLQLITGSINAGC